MISVCPHCKIASLQTTVITLNFFIIHLMLIKVSLFGDILSNEVFFISDTFTGSSKKHQNCLQVLKICCIYEVQMQYITILLCCRAKHVCRGWKNLPVSSFFETWSVIWQLWSLYGMTKQTQMTNGVRARTPHQIWPNSAADVSSVYLPV